MARRLREPIDAVYRRFAPTTRRDLLVGMGFTLAGAVEFGAGFWPHLDRLVGAVPFLAALFTITFRRYRPLLPLAAITAITGGASLVASLIPGLAQGGGGGPASIIIGLLFGTFSLGMHGNRRELAIGAFLPLLMITEINLLDPAGNSLVGGLIFTAIFVVGAPLAIGRLMRDRSRLVAELRQQEALLRAAREASAEAARVGEKLELAAEMQVILTTGMDRLVAQSRLAQFGDEHHRLSAIGDIEAMSRELLGELGEVLSSISPGPSDSRWTRQRVRAFGPEADSSGAGMPRNVSPVNAQRRSLAQRLGARWDLWLGAALFAGLAVQVLTSSNAGVARPLAVLACLAVAAPLSVARRRPLFSVSAAAAGLAIFSVTVLALTDLFTAAILLLVLPFVVGAFEDRRRALVGLAICLLSALAVKGLDLIAGIAPLLVAAWLAGRMLRDRTRLASALRDTNRRLALEQGENDRRIVLEERARMARDVHDVVGHSLTVVALQAGAARRLWNHNREKAEAALVTIAQVAEAGVRDLNRSADLGANSKASSADAPRPLEIHDLVERAQFAGLTVGVHVDGSQAPLNPDAELAAYRLVQEALTNVLKHVPGATAEISLNYGGDSLEVAVVNPIEAPPSDDATGRGLRGMRERVSACGGTLDWGPNPAGEFEVRPGFRWR